MQEISFVIAIPLHREDAAIRSPVLIETASQAFAQRTFFFFSFACSLGYLSRAGVKARQPWANQHTFPISQTSCLHTRTEYPCRLKALCYARSGHARTPESSIRSMISGRSGKSDGVPGPRGVLSDPPKTASLLRDAIAPPLHINRGGGGESTRFACFFCLACLPPLPVRR